MFNNILNLGSKVGLPESGYLELDADGDSILCTRGSNPIRQSWLWMLILMEWCAEQLHVNGYIGVAHVSIADQQTHHVSVAAYLAQLTKQVRWIQYYGAVELKYPPHSLMTSGEIKSLFSSLQSKVMTLPSLWVDALRMAGEMVDAARWDESAMDSECTSVCIRTS